MPIALNMPYALMRFANVKMVLQEMGSTAKGVGIQTQIPSITYSYKALGLFLNDICSFLTKCCKIHREVTVPESIF